MDGNRASPQVRQKGLEAGTRLPPFLGCPLPHQGSELGHGDPRPPASERPPGETPPGQASGNGESGGRRAQKVAVRGERAAAQARATPPRSPRPPGSRRAHRLHGGGHVVVALRLLRQSRSLQQLLSVPHFARDSASPRTPAAPARSLARPSASRSPPRTRTGSPAGGRLKAGPPLAPSRWLAAHAVASAAEPPREDRGRRGRAGRTRPRLRTRSGPARATGGGGAAQP